MWLQEDRVCIYICVCVWVCECVLLFSTWSLVINQDGGVRGKSSPSANWRTLSQRVPSVCLSECVCVCERKRWRELRFSRDKGTERFSIDVPGLYVRIRMCTFQSVLLNPVCVCVCVCVCVRLYKEQMCPQAERLLEWAACVVCYSIPHPHAHAAHYHSWAKGSGQGYRVRGNLWELSVFFFLKKKKEIGCLAEENAEVKHICHLVSYGLEASRGDVETWRLKGKIMICIQISEFKIGTLMHHEVPFGIPALCNIGVRVYKVHLNASWGPCPCAAQMGQMWYWFEFSPRNDT